MREDQTRPQDGHESALLAISDSVIRVYKDRFGRGPTRGRARWAGDDTILVLLEDTLTSAERNLIRMGEHQRLRETRMLFQYSAVQELCGPVEAHTGRKVRAFLSGMDTEADGLSFEAFVLHPEGYAGPSRTQLAA